MSDNNFMPDSTGKIDYDKSPVSKSIQNNLDILKQIFKNDETVIYREFANQTNPELKFLAISANGMVNGETIYNSVIRPLTIFDFTGCEDIISTSENQIITNIDVKRKNSFSDVAEAVLYGDTALFSDGSDEVLLIDTKGWQIRSISEPDSEKNLRGPREGFTESLLVNTSLLRRRIQTSDLKFEFLTFGTRTNTRACICYLDSLADKKVLDEFRHRLKKIVIDGILDANYIEEFIKDSRLSPLKTTGTSEKPDIVASKLLEGRVALILDGTPIVITVPYLFIENFQAPDDYYLNFFFSSLNRVLRITALFITVAVPGVYISLVAFHHEMIPALLLTSIAAATRGIPFPTVVECLLMLAIFEILRETGLRMSNKVGQALSIVGGLVVGQAAVEARIVSAPMVIVIAITGITGMVLPKLTGAVLFARTGAILLSAMFGFLGFFVAMLFAFIHVISLKSFSYDHTAFSVNPKKLKDIYIRAPMWKMDSRTEFSADKKRTNI